jgi:cadmium resistance protein CadD (predicted permease)
MVSKNISGLISGIALIALGIFLIGVGFNIDDRGGIIAVGIYGLIALGIGIFMLFNLEKEDKVEQIKKVENKTNKKSGSNK